MNNSKENFIYLNINKTNTELIASNSKVCYIIGIGKTDYTIHKHANEIREYYNSRKFFKNWSVNLMHNYHVFQSRLKSICGEIRFRDSFKYKGEIVNVKRAFIGIPDFCEIKYNEGGRKQIDSLTSEVNDYKLSDKKLMYIIEIDKNRI